MEPPNFFDLLAKDLLYTILDHLRDDPSAPKFFSQACKSFYALESTHRTALRPRRLDFLPRAPLRYPSILHLDLTLCPCVDDFALKALSFAWRASLRSVDLSRCKFFSHVGLSALALNCTCLVEVDLSNRPDLTDVAAKAIAEAVNLERLRLGRCKGITDMGIGCIAVRCGRLRHVGLRWCIRVTDFGAGLIAIKCKEIRSLDLSYMPVMISMFNDCEMFNRSVLSLSLITVVCVLVIINRVLFNSCIVLVVVFEMVGSMSFKIAMGIC